MHTTSILYRRGRTGTSTILGTLIFIGIMFTAVIPMLLVMRQADTFYEKEKLEGGRLDEEHSREDIDFYIYTEPGVDEKIYVKIENRGNAPVKIVRVWINKIEYFQEEHPQGENINSMVTKSLDPLTVTLQDLTSYTVKVVTEKGNVFSSEAGTLYYSSSTYGWYTPSLGICVHIENLKGKYQIIIKINKEDEEPWYEYSSDRDEHEEIEKICWVDLPGTYYVTIKKDDPGLGFVLDVIPPYDDKPIDVLWPATKPITDVYASGIYV